MIEKISEEDLIIYETLCNPIACAEILFDDYDNLSSFSEDKFGEVRMYQYPFLSFDTQFLFDESKTTQENFNIKKGLAEGYILGGRLTGKSLFALIVDCLMATFHKTYNWGVVSSLDDDHVKNVMEKIVVALENHPLLKLLETYKNTQRKPYHIVANNGCLLESVNDNLCGKNPGQHWFSKHIDKNWAEEASFMTKAVTNKKLMAQSELGCINRFSGMTTFPKVSPMGEIFYNLGNQDKIVNTPSYVNPRWTKEKDDAALLEFGGLNSPGYQVQIVGRVIENGDSVYDIDRIRETYIKDNPIKAFEINKNNYYRYHDFLVLDRPNNAEKLLIALDVGEGGAPTEIIILSQTNGIYKYIYNITTFKLTPVQEKDLIEELMESLHADFVGIDITSGGGKALVSYLSQKYSEHMVSVSFNENIDIDFAKDNQGNVIFENGKPTFKQERVDAWAIQCLKKIFYNGKIKCLQDSKLDTQFDGVISKTSTQGKPMYGYKTANHLHQAFMVFAIMDFLTEFKKAKPIRKIQKSFGAS